MKTSYLLGILLLFSNLINSQVIDNKIQGYYQAGSDSNMYSFFEFDGDGKVNIAGLGTGDYFTKADSLIIYPDKSIFKFKIKGKTLLGVSSWVENKTWVRKDTLTTDNRKDAAVSQNKAALLYEYYKLTGTSKALDFMLAEKIKDSYTEKISVLCNKGLGKACLDYFGILLIQDQGLGSLLKPEKNKKVKPANKQLIALGNKIIAQGEPEGYTVLGSYYYILGDQKKAEELWNTGADKGSQKSAMALFQLEIGQ
ncbi:hypothetical protein [Flavobacterium sp. Root420]|uniref:hypothetical protein n=1 Tax=Flavobacterium sp. Root420 TaxID=1736533 RepID=UPI0006F30860|nr:hypothetical protein [Flavobacterium sp. Root420]KQX00845.1 hypothetical protein ASC72_08280 [Flavobacterium sp. Root420]